MPIYQNSQQLYDGLKELLTTIEMEFPESVQIISKSRLIMSMRCNNPAAEVTINGRHNPAKIIYGPSKLRPDIEIELSADTLHKILLGEFPLSKALAAGELRVRGPVLKSFIFQDIFHRGQSIYPEICKNIGVNA